MKVQIVITLSDRGEINVQGPLRDRILCLGLLEEAKMAVIRFGGENGPGPQIIPAGGPVNIPIHPRRD